METAFSKNMVKARKRMGWGQQEAADMLELPFKNLGSYEQGRARPPYDILFRIAEVYGIAAYNLKAFINEETFSFDTEYSATHAVSVIERKFNKAAPKVKAAVKLLLDI